MSRVDLDEVASLERLFTYLMAGPTVSRSSAYPRTSIWRSDLLILDVNKPDDAVRILTEQPFEYNCVAGQQLDKVPIQIERKVQVQSKIYKAVR